jgi:hypothetical protein
MVGIRHSLEILPVNKSYLSLGASAEKLAWQAPEAANALEAAQDDFNSFNSCISCSKICERSVSTSGICSAS